MIAILAALIVLQSPGVEPANPAANARTRTVLEYLVKLPAKGEKRILSGQFTDYGPGAKLVLCEEAFRQTGHWPAVIGLDYADYSRGHRLHTSTVNRLAIDYARSGGLVTISAHLPNPANPNGGGLRDKGVDLGTLLDTGHANHRRWIEQLDLLAAGLGELRDAGVVVLWRPFHEMNGNWFWWGGKDPVAFQNLWRQMFAYFSETKKLDNLLWVYGPNHGSKVAAYYPGDRFADVVGLDAYTDFVDPAHIKGYRELAAIPKPFGFTEFGPHGASNPPGDYDYPRLLSGINEHFPEAKFFMAWNGKWALSRNRNAKALLDNPEVINREDLPKGLASPRAALNQH
jgi:mannan endo-1,4-beta-mannosidase